MNKNNTKENWEKYKQKELYEAEPILTKLGFILEERQVHIGGERHLMSGFKLVLSAKYKKNKQKVIIKISSRREGKREIKHEYQTRRTIQTIKFAYRNLLLPKELLFIKKGKFIIYVTQFIKQEKSFLEHSTPDQFFLVLRALESQEATHITTRSHAKNIKKAFGIFQAKNYSENMESFANSCSKNNSHAHINNEIIKQALNFINSNLATIEKYSNFLTHSDFVPHNIRVFNHDLYLLDYVSIIFGNKYESWARFINYMIIYNPELEFKLLDFVKNNKEPDEYLSLKLMRLYKIGFLLDFYSKALKKTEGNLFELTKKRIYFWGLALEAILNNSFLDKNIVDNYKKERDALRSKEEIFRQKALKQFF